MLTNKFTRSLGLFTLAVCVLTSSGVSALPASYVGKDQKAIEISEDTLDGEPAITYRMTTSEDGKKQVLWTRTYSRKVIDVAVEPLQKMRSQAQKDLFVKMVAPLIAAGIILSFDGNPIQYNVVQNAVAFGIGAEAILFLRWALMWFPQIRKVELVDVLDYSGDIKRSVKSGQELGHQLLRAFQFIECNRDLGELTAPTKQTGPPSLDDVLNE